LKKADPAGKVAGWRELSCEISSSANWFGKRADGEGKGRNRKAHAVREREGGFRFQQLNPNTIGVGQIT